MIKTLSHKYLILLAGLIGLVVVVYLDNSFFRQHNNRELLKDLQSNQFHIESPYIFKGNKIYYKSYPKDTEVIGVNRKTFYIFGCVESPGIGYICISKDDKRVYVDNKILPEADSSSFINLSGPVFRDNNTIYHLYGIGNWTQKSPLDALEKISSVDYNSFKSIGLNYFVDNENVYFLTTKIKGADIKTFKPVEKSVIYAKDKNNVYIMSNILKGADPETFELISDFNTPRFAYRDRYARDRNHVFIKGKIIDQLNPKTFKLLDYYYSVDNTTVWLETLQEGGAPIIGADPATFAVSSSKYEARDKNHTYLYWQIKE